MKEMLLGDMDGTAHPIVLALIAIVLTVLMLGCCTGGGECDGGCCIDRSSAVAK